MRKFRAFTLIELLVVVAFLSLMVLVSILTFKNQLFKGYDARRKSDLSRIKIAVEEYEKDHNCYPPYLPSCNASDAGILKSYIPVIPCDPHTKKDYIYYTDPNSDCASWAWIFTNLEYTGDPKIEEIGCQYGCGYSQDFGFNYYITTPGAPEPFKSGSSSIPPDINGEYYGCSDGVCRKIGVDPDHLPLCTPNFTNSNCRNLCTDDDGNPINECNPPSN